MNKKDDLKKQVFVFGLNSVAYGTINANYAGVFVVHSLKKPSKNGKVKKDGSDLGNSGCNFYFLSVESIDTVIGSLKDLRKKMNKNKNISRKSIIVKDDHKKLAIKRKKK